MPGPYEIMGYEESELMGEDVEDLLGDEDDYDEDELLGYGSIDDFDEGALVGARRRRRARAKRRVRRTKYTRDRGLIMGLGSQTIATGVTAPFLGSPQVLFRAKRVIITATGVSATIDDIVVEDIKIGKNSQLVTAAGFPAAGFSPTAFDIGIKFDTASPGIDIVVECTNNDVADAVVTVGMFGYAAER